MAIDSNTLLNWQFDDVGHSYNERDSILYALGVGLGRDPLNRDELNYVYEQNLKTLPTMAVTMATLGMWVKNPATGITWNKLVHSGQNAVFHHPLPSAGKVTGKAEISEVYDRGAEKGAVIVVKRSIYDAETEVCYCTLEQTLMLRADGGFGGATLPKGNQVSMPDRQADVRLSQETTPGQAIIYRLSGDWNPLHIDPDVATQAGFSQPILHGYCSYAIAGWAVCQAAKQPASALKELSAQFTFPVLPGNSIEFEFWQQSENEWLFNATSNGKLVLNKCRARFSS